MTRAEPVPALITNTMQAPTVGSTPGNELIGARRSNYSVSEYFNTNLLRKLPKTVKHRTTSVLPADDYGALFPANRVEYNPPARFGDFKNSAPIVSENVPRRRATTTVPTTVPVAHSPPEFDRVPTATAAGHSPFRTTAPISGHIPNRYWEYENDHLTPIITQGGLNMGRPPMVTSMETGYTILGHSTTRPTEPEHSDRDRYSLDDNTNQNVVISNNSNQSDTDCVLEVMCGQLALTRIPLTEPGVFDGRSPLAFPLWKINFDKCNVKCKLLHL